MKLQKIWYILFLTSFIQKTTVALVAFHFNYMTKINRIKHSICVYLVIISHFTCVA